MLVTLLWYVCIVLLFLHLCGRITCVRCSCHGCLIGKTVLITGATSGIGYQVALRLAGRGCRLIIAAVGDLEAARRRIVEETGNENVVAHHLDLGCFASVRRFADDVLRTEARLDVLVNNAGAAAAAAPLTADGLDPIMQTNHLGPFLLTVLLADLLKRSAPSRVIFTSSVLAFYHDLDEAALRAPLRFSIPGFFRAYGNSKLCSIVTAKVLADKLRAAGVTSNALHPGSVRTQIFRGSADSLGMSLPMALWLAFNWVVCKSAADGSHTTVHLALCKQLGSVTGRFFWDCCPFPTPPAVWNKEFCRRIWERSEEIVQLRPNEML